MRIVAAVALGLWLVGALMWFLFDVWVQFGCDKCAGTGAIVPLAAWLVAYAGWLTWTVVDRVRATAKPDVTGSWLRWLSVLPAAVVGGAVPYIAGLPVVNYLDPHTLSQDLVRVLALFLVSASLVWFGSQAAPSRQVRVGMALAVLYIVVWIALGVLANAAEERSAIALLLVLPSVLGAGAAVLGTWRAGQARQGIVAVSPS